MPKHPKPDTLVHMTAPPAPSPAPAPAIATEHAVTQARDTKQLLLDRITNATDEIRRLEITLQRARETRARCLQEAAASQLTTPGERQQAAGISKQHRQSLEALDLPPREPDPRTTTSYTDPLFTAQNGDQPS